MRIIIFTITVLLLLGNPGLSQTSRSNTESEKSVSKQTVRSVAADKHVTVDRKNKQWKTNTTLGMFRGRSNKTNRHNYFGNQDRLNGDDSDSSEDEPKSTQPLKKKKNLWEKLKFLQNK